MKKSLLLSGIMHLAFVFLVMQGFQGKTSNPDNIYVVDLLNLSPSIEFSSAIIPNNVISSIAPKTSEALAFSQSQKTAGISETLQVSNKNSKGAKRFGANQPEEFSPDNYMTDIKKKITQYAGSSGSATVSEDSSQPSQSASTGRKSLAARIFPLNQKETMDMSVDFQQSGGIPAGNIIPLEYLEGLKIAIQKKWRLPAGEKNYSLIALVSFRIHRDGTITDIYLESGSGIKQFDESTVRAVKDLGCFLPLPDTYHLDYLEVAVKFNVRGIE